MKKRYAAGRFRANRFSAAKWYNNQGDEGVPFVPDFMYGSLSLRPTLNGDIRANNSLGGDVSVGLFVRGKIEVNK